MLRGEKGRGRRVISGKVGSLAGIDECLQVRGKKKEKKKGERGFKIFRQVFFCGGDELRGEKRKRKKHSVCYPWGEGGGEKGGERQEAFFLIHAYRRCGCFYLHDVTQGNKEKKKRGKVPV